MSNVTEFFQSAQTRLTLPSTSVSIWLDGVLCPYLELVEVVRCGWPEFSHAKLAYNTAAYNQSGQIGVEQIDSELSIGKSVRISQIYNGCAPGASAFSFPLFHGQIEGLETKLSDNEEKVEIIAKDFSAILKRITVYGQRVINTSGSTLFLAGSDTTFNENGKPNGTIQPIEKNGRQYTVFCAEPSAGKFWSYAEVIDYLLCEYLLRGELQKPGVERLKVLTEGQLVRDLDITGLNLIEALRRCCERIGLNFKFVACLSQSGPEQAIVFYKVGKGRTVELDYQQRGEQASISKTNIAKFHSIKNFWPITHKYIGQGDFKVHEATFDLVKAWDSSLEDTNYDKFSPSTNADFYKVKNVYRKWCLNEAGDYSGEPYNQGDTFDFSKIFETEQFVARRRRFWPALTNDKQGKSLGYYLQVSFDNGLHWWQYLYAFNNLLDECGVWLSSDQLDVDTWVATLKGLLKFRITASVISDERLSCELSDGPVNSVVPVVDHVITLPRQFKYHKVSAQSVFSNSSDASLGTPDEVDDSTELYEFVRKKAGMGSEVIETVDVQTPYLIYDYRIGDRVACSPESRDLLGTKSDNRSISWIKRVQMDFKNQCTHLKIIRQRNQIDG